MKFLLRHSFVIAILFAFSISSIYAQNWTNAGFTPGQEIGYEQDGNTLWKLTTNNIYKSTNGGASWVQNVDQANAPFYASDYFPNVFATASPTFDHEDSRVLGDFMFLGIRSGCCSASEFWTTPDAGLSFDRFEFDGDFFLEAYRLGNNRYMVQIADFDINAPSSYNSKWYLSTNGGQSFNLVLTQYGRNSRIVGQNGNTMIIHDMNRIYYHDISTLNLTQTVTLPEVVQTASVDGNTIRAISYDTDQFQTSTNIKLHSSTNGGASFSTTNNTKTTGFIFDFSIVDDFLFFNIGNSLYRYNLNNFAAPASVFPTDVTPEGPFKETLDGTAMVNSRVILFNGNETTFNNALYTSTNNWSTVSPTPKVPYALEAIGQFGNTYSRFFGSAAYTTSDGRDFQFADSFFGSALKSDVVYLEDAMYIAVTTDPSTTAFFSNDGVNFTPAIDLNGIDAFDADFFQAGNNLITRPTRSGGPLNLSTDNGNSWSEVPDSYAWGRFMFADQKNGTIYGYQRTFGGNESIELAKSIDNGVTWNFIDTNIPDVSQDDFNGRQGRPFMAYNNHIFLKNGDQLLRSSDGGVTFTSVSFPNSFHNACVYINDGKLHVDTHDEQIYTVDIEQWLGTTPANTPPGYQIDLALDIRLEPANPAPFSDFDVIVTLTNQGNRTANRIVVRQPFLSSPVAVNRGSEQPTYSPNFAWTNSAENSLAPGESATGSFPFFRLDGGEIKTSAFISAALQPDVDSRPGSIVDADNPEDDEAIFPEPNPNGSVITVNCPDNVFKQESSPTEPIGGGFTGFGDVILPEPTATTTCPGGIVSIEHVGTAPTFQIGDDLYLDGPGEYAIFWEITDACGMTETCLYSAEVVIPSFEFGFTNCPQDIVMTAPTNTNGVVVFYDDLEFESNCPTLNTASGISEGFQSGSLFPLGTTTVTHFVVNPQCGTATCSFNVTILSDDGPSNVDLELSMTQSIENPVAFSVFSRTVTITNAGNEAANFIEVSIPLFEGMVFSGGEEFTASQGTFSPYGDQSWFVGALGAGQSAEIEVRYFPLQNITSPGYAQVTSMGTSQDIDSTPNNGTPPIVNEDDEASTDDSDGGGGGNSGFSWENCPSDIIVTAALGSNGSVVNYQNPTLNTSGCAFSISSFGANFDSGDFFPVGTTRVTIFAGNTQCGTVECSFNVTVQPNISGPAGIDLELSMTQNEASPRAFETFQRTVVINNTGTQTASRVFISIPLLDEMVFSGGEEFTTTQGGFAPYGNQLWSIGNLEAGESASITLTYFALENVDEPGYAQVFSMDGSDVDSTPNNGTPPSVNEDDEASTDESGGSGGGGSNNLPDLTISNFTIANNIILSQLTNYSLDLNNLGNVAAVDDYSIELFLSMDNTFSVNDVFVGNIRTGNTFPGSIPGIDAQLIASSFPVGPQYLIVVVDANDEIEESNESNNITAYNVNVVSPMTTSDGADINLSVGLNEFTQAQYEAYSITYTVTNEGNESTSNLEIDVPVPSGVVYSAGEEFEATKGSLGIYFDDVWRVGSLGPGESVELSIIYYKLSAGAIQHYAQVIRSSGDDPDSTPNNGQCCTANEDDEVSIQTNTAQARISKNNSPTNAFTILDVVPNPSNGERVVLRLEVAEAQTKEIYIYDLLGKQVVAQKEQLVQGYNEVTLRTQELPSGYYQVLIEDVNMKFVPTRFIIDKL